MYYREKVLSMCKLHSASSFLSWSVFTTDKLIHNLSADMVCYTPTEMSHFLLSMHKAFCYLHQQHQLQCTTTLMPLLNIAVHDMILCQHQRNA
jgi:hypothetical protein